MLIINAFSFSYIESERRCIIPDYDQQALTFTKRLSFITEEVLGAEYYMFNPEIVATGRLPPIIRVSLSLLNCRK